MTTAATAARTKGNAPDLISIETKTFEPHDFSGLSVFADLLESAIRQVTDRPTGPAFGFVRHLELLEELRVAVRCGSFEVPFNQVMDRFDRKASRLVGFARERSPSVMACFRNSDDDWGAFAISVKFLTNETPPSYTVEVSGAQGAIRRIAKPYAANPELLWSGHKGLLDFEGALRHGAMVAQYVRSEKRD